MSETEEKLTCILAAVAEREFMIPHELSLQPFCSGGSHFMSVIYTGTIKSPNREDIKIFAKMAHLPGVIRDETDKQVLQLFDKESLVYTNLAPSFEVLQDRCGLSEEECYRFPKFYFRSLEEHEGVIILEDLSARGYAMWDRMRPVDWELASKAVASLAKFHALSLAYKRNYPEDYESDFNRTEYEMGLEKKYEKKKNWLKRKLENGQLVVPEHLKARLRSFIKMYWSKEMFLRYHRPSKCGFLVHGDFRPSNVLYRRQGDEVKKIILVDYQSIHLGSPVRDLLYFTYLGTDVGFRGRYMHQLIDLYHATLAGFLRQLGLDHELEYPKSELQEDYREMLPYGLCIGISTLPAVLAENDAIKDLQAEGAAAFERSKFSETYQTRFTEMLNEYIEFGFL